MTFTPKIDLALRISAKAHRNQLRRGSNTPYIIHPFAVMHIASMYTKDEDVLIACLLHDIIEDVPKEYTEKQMINDFGQEVHKLVKGVTKNKTLNWKKGCDQYLKYLQTEAPEGSAIIAAADKIHNIMSILEDYENLGDKVWELFTCDKKAQQWWFNSSYNVISKKIPNNKILVPLKDYLDKINKIIES